MSSITLHNLDPAIVQRIEQLVAETGSSPSEVIKTLLREVLEENPRVLRPNDFEKFAPTWTDQEAEVFAKNTTVFNQIDKELWD